MELIKILLWFVLWLFSSLFVFYVTERIKKIKESKIRFYKISVLLRQLLMLIISFESACKQYIEINKYKLKDIWSIWFPNYDFPLINELIPYILYEKKEEDFLFQLNEIERVIFSLNNLIKDLAINEIKEDLLSKRLSIDESELRYKQELKFIENQLYDIPSYIEHILLVLSKINLINRFNTKSFLLNLNTRFSEKEIYKECEILKKEFYNSFLKTEDIEI